MTTLLLYSIIFITAALLFYSIGVWSERWARRLKPWHLVMFWLGVVTDTIGTGLMIEHVGYVKFNLHTTSGFISLLLMLVHAVWARVVIYQRNQLTMNRFHRFSVFVWTIWMLSYVSGVVMGMNRIR